MMDMATTQAATPLGKHFPLSLPVPQVYPFSQQYVLPQLKWSEGQEEEVVVMVVEAALVGEGTVLGVG